VPRILRRAACSLALAALLAAPGCDNAATAPPPGRPAGDADARDAGRAPGPATAPAPADVSGDTPADLRFGEFVRQAAGGMVKDVAVGIERRGLLQVVLGEQAAPEDTLPLTRSLIAGARKDYPGKAFAVAVFDPSESLILKAHYDPGQGVRYDLDGSDGPAGARAPEPDGRAPDAPARPDAGGISDDEFQRWAMEAGHGFLRYVESDLRRSGRVWFGVTREVAPADVPDLTRSLLEGARTEFPDRELTATVYDPEGERIGRATLGADGRVDWQR
jgi:hypothetical protein